MTNHPDDRRLDAALRSGEMSAELRARLREIGSLSDADLDASLRHVAVPGSLRARLLAIGTLEDRDLDDELRHVALPANFAAQLQVAVAPARFDARRLTRQLALAASLLLMVSLGTVAWLNRQPADEADLLASLNVMPSRDGEAIPLEELPLAAVAPPSLPVDSAEQLTDDSLRMADAIIAADDLDRARQQEQSRLQAWLDAETFGPVNWLADLREAQSNVWRQVLGSQMLTPKPPTFDVGIGPLEIRGIAPPRATGYDLLFQSKNGVHPFVYPSAHKDLAVSRVPLAADTFSFDMVRRAAGQHRLPPPYQVRVEDFLAAVDYQFSPPAKNAPLAIRTAAGPSALGTPGTQLLQIGVQAGTVPRPANAATHLVVALDVSASMNWDGGFDAARRAIHKLIERLNERDQLSLIVFNDEARVFLERVGRLEAEAMRSSLDALEPRGLPNVPAALELTSRVAKAGRDGAALPTAVVLVTANQVQMDAATLARMEELLQRVAQRSARIRFIDVRRDGVPDMQLEQLAIAAQGKLAHVATAGKIAGALGEALTGQEQKLATDATLVVKFKPEAVAAYRLLGHEATTPVGVLVPPLEAELFAGEAATVLYEVALRPDGPEVVATAELAWSEPASGERRQLQQPISRLQFATSPREMALSLQLAALAVETAEVLRNSYFAPANTHTLAAVAEAAKAANPRLRNRRSFAELLELVELAQQARLNGGTNGGGS